MHAVPPQHLVLHKNQFPINCEPQAPHSELQAPTLSLGQAISPHFELVNMPLSQQRQHMMHEI